MLAGELRVGKEGRGKGRTDVDVDVDDDILILNVNDLDEGCQFLLREEGERLGCEEREIPASSYGL